tara:strand:- start:1019 stop:1744 length:726 start_codon:yes stop_codon:yes gene_type:complete
MDKQTPSTSVRHNDAYSKALIESYAQWMDGDRFQGSNMEEQVPAYGGVAEKPAETKDSEEAIVTPIGTIPKPAFDQETIPTLKVVNTDDGGTKDPKFNAGPPDSTKNKSSYGAQIKNLMVKKEEVEPVEEGKKAKKDYDGDGKVESGKAEYFGSKDKAIKKAMKKEDIDARQSELWDEASKILTELSELTDTTYTVTGEKWDKDQAEGVVPSTEAPKPTTSEAYKAKARKTAKKILGYSKK